MFKLSDENFFKFYAPIKSFLFNLDAKAITSLVKSVKLKIIFLISEPKHMLWVLKITVSQPPKWDCSLKHLKDMIKLMGKKIFTILHAQILFIETYENFDNFTL